MHNPLHVRKTDSGKRKFQPVATTTVAGHSTKGRLFYIYEKIHRYHFLVDTGAEISVLPTDPKHRTTPSPYKLQAANGTQIETYGERSLTLDLGMRKNFLWIFTQANVTTPILGADFLTHFNLSVNMATRTLIDNQTDLSVKGISTSFESLV